jgi:hypothetical protein
MGSGIQTLLVGLLFLTGTGILLLDDWRWKTGLLGLQYMGVFGLVSVSWPVDISVVKLVAGWMAAAVLFRTSANISEEKSVHVASIWVSGASFRFITALLIAISVYSLVPSALRWFLGATALQVLGGLTLLGLGLLQLGLTQEGIRIVIGLLTVLSGFEILYATLEASVLMTGLLAILTISISFVGAYLLLAPGMEESR